MSELTIKSAASRNGAPGRLTGAWLPMKNAYVSVKSVGPITPVSKLLSSVGHVGPLLQASEIQKNNTALKKEERLDSP